MKPGKGIVALASALVLIASSAATERKPQSAFAQAGSSSAPIAFATQRIPRDDQKIQVYQGGQLILLGYFTELAVATDLNSPEALIGKTIWLERSREKHDRWEVRSGAAWGPALPANVFKVQQAFLCTAEKAIAVKVNGQTHRLRPGDTLLVLG